MESVLVLTHLDEGGAALTKGSLEAVTAGTALADRLSAALTIGIVGTDVKWAGRKVAATGARLMGVGGQAFAHPRFATDAAGCEALCRAAKATLVIAPGSSRLARVAASVAHRVGGAIDTHITSLHTNGGDGGERLDGMRWFYRQRVEAVFSRDKRPWFLLLEPGTHTAWAGEPANALVEELEVSLPALRTHVIGIRSPEKDQQTIRPDAKLLFVAGAGWTKKQPDGETHGDEAGQLILDFLRGTSASLGSSKSLVDQGGEGHSVLPFLTHLNQVGQTGSTPRHAKGLSTCCHGEEPHVVGWRFIGERRAISLDANCGWTRGKADVVYVADAFQVIGKLNSLLAEKKPETIAV